MDKFNRNFRLAIQVGKFPDFKTIYVERPFTIEIDIHRNSFSSANTASFRIYNLNENNRSQIRKDQFATIDQRTVELAAGYGTNLAVAFKGNITQAWSSREGTNMVTQIECFDSGYDYCNAVTNTQFPSDSTNESIIKSLIESLPTVGMGAIGSVPGKLTRGNSFNGNTADLLTDLTGSGFFIDNGLAHVLGDQEALNTDIIVISPSSGLIGTPIKEQTFITLDMLFEPGLKVGQLVQLKTQTANHFDGQHKVISIKHSGVISDSVSGSLITSVGLLPGMFTTVGGQ